MKVIDPERLIRARKRQGYSQRNLAALCDCTQAAISALETGTMRGCSEPLAKSLARWLDRDTEELFSRHESVRMPAVPSESRSIERGVRREAVAA